MGGVFLNENHKRESQKGVETGVYYERPAGVSAIELRVPRILSALFRRCVSSVRRGREGRSW